AARSITAEDVLDVLAELFVVRGVPGHMRSDNGPEFIARAVQRWLKRTGACTLYIAPGAPWENGYAESFHSRLRDELLNVEEFTTIAEARLFAERWQLDYNHRRPHSALGYRTTAEFAAMASRSDIHEEASVKTGARRARDFPRHPFGIIRPRRSAMKEYAVAPIHTGGVALRHVGPRDATFSPVLDLDVDPVKPLIRACRPATEKMASGVQGRQ